jgi:hypothetical protein
MAALSAKRPSMSEALATAPIVTGVVLSTISFSKSEASQASSSDGSGMFFFTLCSFTFTLRLWQQGAPLSRSV